MSDVQYEEKFIVINMKHLDALIEEHPDVVSDFIDAYNKLAQHLPKNKYYVCNQDEPYADEVLTTILNGEREKRGTL